MIFLIAYFLRRISHNLLIGIISFSLIWSPVFQARAFAPALIIPVGIAAARVFAAAAARVGPLLTHTNTAVGTAAGGLAFLADRNWEDIVQYTKNAASASHAAISSGVMSFAALANSVGINSVQTDLATFSWSGASGVVYSSYGSVPMKDALPSVSGDTTFPYQTRSDGFFLYQALSGHSFSSVVSYSGLKTYLCPVLDNSFYSATKTICRTLPEVPISDFNFYTQYPDIGIACNEPLDCAKAYISARLAYLSWEKQNGMPYSFAIKNASANFLSCFDSRYSSYSLFSGYRCPVELSYDKADLLSGSPQTFTAISETHNIDIRLSPPPFSQSQTLNDLVANHPQAGSEPLSPAAIASIINAMFQRAATRPGYEGLNYFPITAVDVIQGIGSARVPLSSLLTEATTTSTSVPDEGTTPPPPPPVPGATLDLGADPGISAPTLDAIPTAAQIMAPIFDLFPSLRNFQTPGHTSQCPAISVPFFGEEISTNKHCELLESQRAPLGAAALAGWSIAVLIIVLGA